MVGELKARNNSLKDNSQKLQKSKGADRIGEAVYLTDQ